MNNKITLTKAQDKQIQNLPLPIELVPTTAWWSNVRSNVTSSQWKKIKAIVFEASGHKCEICGGVGKNHPVECHEVWEYDEKEKFQKLLKFQALCPLCHQVKHIGLTGSFIFGIHALDRAMERFQIINELSSSDAVLFHDFFWQQWRERSKYEWKIDISLLEQYNVVVKDLSSQNNTPKSSPKPKLDYKIDKEDFKCPYCKSKNVIRNGRTSSMFRYKCKDCSRSFSSEFLVHFVNRGKLGPDEKVYFDLD